VVEQVIRPTGLLDPMITVKPLATQVDDLLEQVRERAARHERVLVTTLTKRMSEDLTEYLRKAGVRVRYLHSEVHTIDRTELIRDLRLRGFDVLVGVNLLREGLDLPEVSLVAILDADKEGFLRSARSLIQTAGRAARNQNGEVIFYADKITDSMRKAIDETNRRRAKQQAFNEKHGIDPRTVFKTREEILSSTRFADSKTVAEQTFDKPTNYELMSSEDQLGFLVQTMKKAAENLDFETAILIREEIDEIQRKSRKGKTKRAR